MAYINFVIPQSLSEMLRDSDEQYFVKNVIGEKEMPSALKVARQCYKDQGPEYILDNFDVYYSILHHADKLKMHEIFIGYEHLHKAAQDLHKSVAFLLDDRDNLTEEFKLKYLNVMKMLLYAYTNMVTMIEQKNENKRMQTLNVKLKGRKKTEDGVDNFTVDRRAILMALTYLLQLDIHIFWDPPVVEEVFVKMVSEVCYKMLEIPSIKSEKDTLLLIWSMLGLLVKNLNHGMTFIVRMVQLIKIHEHLVYCVPEGIKHIIETYQCKSLVRDLVREITEWQCDEQFADSQGTRNCSKVLSEMASAMPNLMIPEVVYLNQYLAHESYSLRNSVLNVIVEVILVVLTKENLNDEERESRDELLSILEEHTNDISPHVRSKVFNHWKCLQQENAIPLSMQTVVLEHAVTHLRDKSAIVRKCAAHCVTVFLQHNIFSANLQLSNIRDELAQKSSVLNEVHAEMEGIKVAQLKELENEWDKHEKNIREAMEKLLEDASQETDNESIDSNTIPQLVRFYITEGKYKDAAILCRHASKTSDQFKDVRGQIESEQEVELFVLLMKTIFCNVSEQLAELSANQGNGPSKEDFERLNSVGRTVDYLKDTVKFLELIDRAREPMKYLLESASLGDMQEAVDFFVAAYKFNIDSSHLDILDMLSIMQRSEQDRREIVLDALKLIYLTTDSKSSQQHTTKVVNGLIALLKVVPYNKEGNLTLMISEWTSKGILDNSIIDALWQYVTKKIDVSDDDSRAALHLLTMAAQGRRTIISRNIKLVTTIAFGERGYNDILFVTQACRILAISGMEKQEITDKNPPFKIKATDEIWQQLGDLIVTVFAKKIKFVNHFLSAAIDFIYRLCSTPIKICQNLVKSLINKVSEVNENMPMFVIIRCNWLLGEIALKHLNFLDETIYKELKRRQYIRDERLNMKDSNKVTNKAKKNKLNKSNISSLNTTNVANISVDENVLEGAQADDQDAEFISHVLESCTVSGSSDLGKLAYMIISVCEQPHIYDDIYIQCSSITALLRFMLVANNFCKKYIPLIFTILEKTSHDEVKIAILIHCSDLLEKCPNIIEPFTPKIFKRLEDKSILVRKSTFYMLSNLILRDMIRAQGFISKMARCVVDEEKDMMYMAKDFFSQLSHKGNNLYNVLPDIFSHLADTESEENLRKIMVFLFGLIDKNKHMENLVDRFCSKFKLTENEMVSRNIAYCLTLVNYNEKGFKKLIENFTHYKHLVLVNEIYLLFKQIITSCSKGTVKAEIKTLSVDLEEKIKEMFETTENAEIKIAKKHRVPKKTTSKKILFSDDSGSESGNDVSRTNAVKKTSRTRGRKRYINSDSD